MLLVLLVLLPVALLVAALAVLVPPAPAPPTAEDGPGRWRAAVRAEVMEIMDITEGGRRCQCRGVCPRCSCPGLVV